MGIKRFEDLNCWQYAQELAVFIYETFREMRDFSFRDQICRAAVSISNNIAEGFDRHSNKELLRFLSIARGSNSEVKSMIYLVQKLHYINQQQFDEAIAKCDRIGKTINGFRAHLIRSLSSLPSANGGDNQSSNPLTTN